MFRLRPFLIGLSLLATAPVLSACSDNDSLTRTFGLTRDAPDEFQVTTRAPLSMPPDFTLRPPRPGVTRPQELPLAAQAEAALVPSAALRDRNAGRSAGQQALVSAAGPSAPADIRNTVDEEAHLDRTPSLMDRLLFWKQPDPPGTVVDAKKESQRLRENAALGQSPSVNTTPIIDRQHGGLMDGIF